jgi:hypothetical protein
MIVNIANSKADRTKEWHVYRVGGPKPTLLGTVLAPSRETALGKAYKEFGILSPRERQRIIVQRTSDPA